MDAGKCSTSAFARTTAFVNFDDIIRRLFRERVGETLGRKKCRPAGRPFVLSCLESPTLCEVVSFVKLVGVRNQCPYPEPRFGGYVRVSTPSCLLDDTLA